MLARIYQPSKTAMQSGRGKTRHWLLEYELSQSQHRDPLMGWTGQGSTLSQIQLRFPTLEAAIAYAQTQNLAYVVEGAHKAKPPLRPYAQNFTTLRS